MRKVRHREVIKFPKATQLVSGKAGIPPLYCKGPMVMTNKQWGTGEGVPGLNPVFPFSILASQSYQNQCFPDPKNAPAGSGTPEIGVLATPSACLPACQGC